MPNFTLLDALPAKRPLIHCVSNIVSANDCANLVLAVGGSPIMAQAAEEMGDIVSAANAVVLNTGTPSGEKFRVCTLAAQAAARLGRPLVLDPVGVGGSPWRLEQVRALLSVSTPAIVRVNQGEALALTGAAGRGQGVDSGLPAGNQSRRDTALALAKALKTVVLLSGAEDMVATPGGQCWQIAGGSLWTARITGAGCMLSALCGVFAAVEPDAAQAAILAAATWKVCARRAERMAGSRGPGSFHVALLDAAGTLTAADLAAAAEIAAV